MSKIIYRGVPYPEGLAKTKKAKGAPWFGGGQRRLFYRWQEAIVW